MIIPENLYSQIKVSMPIPCVELLLSDEQGCVLLVRRTLPPAANQWWFPGGRVHFGESRQAAAQRKLREECGITWEEFHECGTFDVLLPIDGEPALSHAITTVFTAQLTTRPSVALDQQSSASDWVTPAKWREREINPFVEMVLMNCLPSPI